MVHFEFTKKKRIDVIFDAQTASGISKIWSKVEKDIRDTTGAACEVREMGTKSEQAVVVATVGCGTLPDVLEERIPELGRLRGKWESYGFYLAEHPLDGVERGLVIVGSDRLGTIYGMFRLSELLGVTPWGFWGDVEPPVYERILLESEDDLNHMDTDWPDGSRTKAGIWDGGKSGEIRKIRLANGISKEPSVKYRGFFINDEWPCYGTWTFSHYQGFTAEMYEHVFEYLLRLKGNYLWPAMWTSSFLLDGPGLASMELATEYGIYIGMSHHEPCMRSGEEFTIFRGEDSPYGTEWDYVTNKDGLLKFWEDGLKRVRGQRIFPTIGMRGERDSKMLGENSTIEENVRLLKEIIMNQRRLIAKHIHPDLKQVPQLFAVYKEVEDYYFGDGQTEGVRGFEELEDVTLLFCEDNFGNMRALPHGEERNHPGGFGMYYHFDYHGSPVSYEWVNSTPLSKIWEQMTEAYEYGVRELWIVNVGDLKFQEYPLGYFMELAYDFETWGSGAYDRIATYTEHWVRNQFGRYVSEEQLADIAWVLDEYVRLNGLRRPESCNPSVYHSSHYGEGRRMLERCLRLEQKNERLMEQLADTPCGNGYFSMIYFPAAGSANLLKMHLLAGLNERGAGQGTAAANLYGEQMETCIRRDRELARSMAAFRDGKWSGMEKAFHIGFVNWNSEDWRYPVRHTVTLPEEPRLVVARADESRSYTNQYFPIPMEINDFLCPGTEYVTVQIANGGQGAVNWRIDGRCEYLEFSRCEGCTELMDEVEIRVLPERLEEGRTVEFSCHIRTEHEEVPLLIRAGRQKLSEIPAGMFVEQDGLCVMDAADYQKHVPGSQDGEEASFEILKDYGKYGSGVKVFPVTASFGPENQDRAPQLVYEVWIFHAGQYRLQLHASPANPLNYGGQLRMGVAVNQGEIRQVSFTGTDYRGGDHTCPGWCEAVLNQEHTAELSAELGEGANRITVYGGDAGLVLERLVLWAAGKEQKPSYLGPERSFRKA